MLVTPVTSYLLVVASGCSYDWTFVEVVAREAGDATNEATGDEISPPITIECKASDACAVDEYCFFSDGRCGPVNGGALGVCRPTAKACAEETIGACDCLGNAVKGSCEAATSQRADLDRTGNACAKPSPTYACPGALEGCKQDVEFCYLSRPGTGVCKPVSCGAGLTCALCAAELPPPPCTCKELAPGAVQVECP